MVTKQTRYATGFIQINPDCIAVWVMLGRLFGHAALVAPAAAVFSVGLVRVAEPNRSGGESAATGESRSLASVLAGSSSYSFSGHQVVLGGAAGAPTAAPAPAPAPRAGQKRDAMGTGSSAGRTGSTAT